MDSKNGDDLMQEAADRCNDARKLIQDANPEIEAVVLANLGRIYYKGLHNDEKAKKYYHDSLRLLETLKPKTFNE